ncbi:hypothetical protein [Shewanella surugensis]|uniref:Uncharacterized protein n=1 Tax=Shewanella surugensis TaxID=212020 RepID=A0ABT0LK15_9GAMM|nr:hypothetical protein [Shewanella surugensis]MCL1127929.1 hypothetical protein [Shewanella surugensis]
MRIKTLIYICCISLITLLSACSDDDYKTTTFSNIMVFGDSQSDMNNFPQSLYYNHDSGSISPYGISGNLYNSVSEPITSTLFSPISPGTLTFPEISTHYNIINLSSDTQSICTASSDDNVDDASCYDREASSVGWLQYLTYNGLSNNYTLFDTIELSSWVAYTAEGNGIDKLSINYAWYGALSRPTGCYNDDHTALSDRSCSDGKEIYALQATYRSSQILDDGIPPISAADSYALEKTVAVPTLYQQVTELFLPNLEADYNIVDKDTLYVFYSGANDLSAVFFEWIEGKIDFDTFIESIWTTIPEYMIGTSDSAVQTMLSGLNSQGQEKGNIIMFPQFNLGIIPDFNYYFAAQGITLPPEKLKVLAESLGELIKVYNERVKLLTYLTASEYAFMFSESNPKWYFYYLDNLYDNMETLAFSDDYSTTFANTCGDDSTVVTIIPLGSATDCLNSNGDPYLFWNTEHLASPGQQIIAQSALDWLSAGETILDTGVEQKYSIEDLEASAKAIYAIFN